jgi:Tfp pilus assembly PilM family ATPase
MDDINSHAAINISLSKFQILEVAKEGKKIEIVNINECYFNQPLNFETQKETIIAAQLQSTFDKIQLNRPLKKSFVSFTLPQEIIFTVQLPYDSTLLRKDLVDEFRWELSLLYPFIAGEELIVQFVQMEKNSVNKNNMALVLAIEKKHLLLVRNFCMKNNLSLKYVDSAMITANRLLNSINHSSKDGLLLNIISSKNDFSIVFNKNGKPSYLRVFNRSENDQVAEILAKELASSSFGHLKNELLKDAFISGEEISAELISRLRLTTGLNFTQLNPFADIQIKSGIENQHLIKEKYSSFAAAAGMAFRLT